MSKLKCPSCPFTWKVWDDLASGLKLLEYNDKRFRVVDDIQDHFPEFVFIWNLMLAYESTMSDKLEDALHYINEAQKTLAELKRKGKLKNVENVLDLIFFATKYHVFYKLEKSAEVNELLNQIHQHDDMEMDEVKSAMLYGCQCLAWSLYTTPRAKEKEFAKKAVECEPTNGKWHYLLGKSYRDNRRKYMSLASKPSEKESRAFKRAYELSKNDLFGIYWAQSLRESRKNAEAIELYKDVYALQPTSCDVRLKLALGFIREKECELAERCLNYVVGVMPSSPVLAHYMGIYEENCKKDLKAALPYYQTAIDNLRYPAALQYLKCKKRLEPGWDPLPYLLEVLKNCEQNSNIIAQEVNVAIGTYYLYEKEDILSACRYLTEVIKIRPKPAILNQYHPIFGPGGNIKICDTLKEKIQIALECGTENYDNNTIAELKNTLQLLNNISTSNSLSWRVRDDGKLQESRSQPGGNSQHERNSSTENPLSWRRRNDNELQDSFSQLTTSHYNKKTTPTEWRRSNNQSFTFHS